MSRKLLDTFFPPSNKWKLPTLTVRRDLHVPVSWWAVSSFGKKCHTRVFWDIWEAGYSYQGRVGKRSKEWEPCCFWPWHKGFWADKDVCDQEQNLELFILRAGWDVIAAGPAIFWSSNYNLDIFWVLTLPAENSLLGGFFSSRSASILIQNLMGLWSSNLPSLGGFQSTNIVTGGFEQLG